MEDIQKNLATIKNAINNAEKKYQRAPGAVTLVAVSKLQSIEKIKIAHSLGQIHFGENYLQEALPKIRALASTNIIWHYIGKIQSKKTKFIAANFSWVESVASFAIAASLNKYRPPNMSPLNICIQVNISQEINKAGVLNDEILPLAKKIALLPKLKLRGLMTIPAYHQEFDQQFYAFNQLAQEWEKLQQHGIQVDALSMGMSNDFEAAIAAGATMVRIGTAIFGNR